MIVRLFNKAHVIWQTPDTEDDLPNDAVAVCVDNGGSLILRQQGAEIVLNGATVPDLCRLLTKLAKEQARAEK